MKKHHLDSRSLVYIILIFTLHPIMIPFRYPSPTRKTTYYLLTPSNPKSHPQ